MPLTLRSEIATAETDEGLVLLDERSGRYWQLNPMGALMLHALLRGDPPERIARELATRHRADRQHVERDVQALLDRLQAAKLVATS